MQTVRIYINKTIIPLSIALMWCGLLWSRALLSLSMALFILAALSEGSLKEKWLFFKRSPFLWMMSFLFFIPLVSGLWSQDFHQWRIIIQHKAPLLLIPFCCTALNSIELQSYRKLMYLAVITTLISMGKTIGHYAFNTQAISHSYLQAKVLPVDMSNDHVRYAWILLIVFSGLLHLLMTKNKMVSRFEKKGILFYLFFSAVFLHILASKTGILGLYLVIGLAIVFQIRSRLSIWITGISIITPFIAWLILPTFRNRLKFVWWDFQNYSRGGYTEGLSDTPRILSLQAGNDLLKENPFWGTGFGDLKQATFDWYAHHAPYLKEYERLLPSNQGLIYAAGTGLAGLSIFLMAVFYPFFMKGFRSNYAWTSFHALAVFGFIYEIGLETQYGIFVYAFLGCWLFLLFRKKETVP
ncbi:MAG: O-antigen ligase family protein [Chitinophagaceae bacterium]